MKKIILLSAIFISITACNTSETHMMKAFNSTIDGKTTSVYMLSNKNGMEVILTNYGARVVSLNVPDRNGVLVDIVLGYDNIDGYLSSNDPYFGATIGRYANRINGAKFILDSIEYKLAINDICGPNHLHGGKEGFSHKIWDAIVNENNSIQFHYFSPDMEEGYPGNMNVWVTYKLTEDNELNISYRATTDKPTVCNLTHHSYFNLNGAGKGTVRNHHVWINADYYTPVDSAQLPLAYNIEVTDTPFDLRKAVIIGDMIKSDHEQIVIGKGYNHNFILANEDNNSPDAIVWSPETGIKLTMYTDEPGVQFYSCGFMEGKDIGKDSLQYVTDGALCLEAQHYPNSPNRSDFPSTRLDPGKVYIQNTSYLFTNTDKI
jgi:aldose 1-epimerase